MKSYSFGLSANIFPLVSFNVGISSIGINILSQVKVVSWKLVIIWKRYIRIPSLKAGDLSDDKENLQSDLNLQHQSLCNGCCL